MRSSRRLVRYGALAGALAATALALAGYAIASRVGVTLTKTGPLPATVTAALGDSVVFTNGDQTVHIVAAPKLGLKTSALPSGGAYTYLATRVGSWRYQVSDAAGKHQIPGTLVVSKPGNVTLRGPSTVRYGQRIALRGVTPLPGFPVTLEQRDGKNWSALSQITPSPDGSFSLQVKPLLSGGYRADVLGGQLVSTTQKVAVQPRLTLRSSRRRAATGSKIRLTAHVMPAKAVKSLGLQVYNRSKKHWYLVGSGAPNAHGNVAVSFPLPRGHWSLRATTRRLAEGFAHSLSNQVVLVGLGAPPKHKRHH